MTSAATLEFLLRGLGDHLWQSTLVAAAAAVICALLMRSRAQLRYTVLLVASGKFLVPFSALVALGALIPMPDRSAPTATMSAALTMSAPFSSTSRPTRPSVPQQAPPGSRVAGALLLIWGAGSLVVAARRWRVTRRVRDARPKARPIADGPVADAFARVTGDSPRRLELRASRDCAVPCVIGIWRPILLWPDEMTGRLTPAQLDAIIAHEVTHVRQHHNLAAAVHGVVEILFWFHPIVWWMGARLDAERERVCDEHVVQAGAAPDVYADGILRVCEFAMGTAVAGASRITGAPLTKRIEDIMANTNLQKAGAGGRALLVTAGLALLAAPIAAGALNAERPRTMTLQGDETATPGSERRSSVALTGAASQGVIAGVASDERGGRVADAKVTARCAGGVVRTATTDAGGSYILDGVPAGACEVRVEKPGFKSHAASVTAQSGRVTANAVLPIGSLSESVTVATSFSAPDPPKVVSDAPLREAAAAAGDDPKPWQALANLLYMQEQYAESEEAINRANALIAAREAAVARQASYGGVIKEPRKIRDVKPMYPSGARASQTTGAVIVEARIGEDGTVRDVRVLRGVPLLDDAAVGAVRQWQFTPTLLNGAPIEVTMIATVNFVAR